MSRDVYMAIGYKEKNGEKAIQNLVSSKYKLCFRDTKPSLNQLEDILLLHKDTVLLKEPGLYCFLLRCKRDEAEPFMEWIEEKDSVIAYMNDDVQAIKYENMVLKAQRDEYQVQLQGCQDTIPLWRNIQHLSKISFMTCHIISRGYNGIKGILS